MVVGTVAVFLTAFLVGLILVAYRGPELLVVGIASILFGFAYTGGPFPLAYRGLGDVFAYRDLLAEWRATGTFDGLEIT